MPIRFETPMLVVNTDQLRDAGFTNLIISGLRINENEITKTVYNMSKEAHRHQLAIRFLRYETMVLDRPSLNIFNNTNINDVITTRTERVYAVYTTGDVVPSRIKAFLESVFPSQHPTKSKSSYEWGLKDDMDVQSKRNIAAKANEIVKLFEE